jgi:hypothetical protein
MQGEKDSPSLIPPHGGYRALKFCQMVEIVFGATMVFCHRFIDRKSWVRSQTRNQGKKP